MIVVDVLIATRMNLSLRGMQSKMYDSWYIDKIEKKYIQSMIFSDNHQLKEQLKDIKQILKEYNL